LAAVERKLHSHATAGIGFKSGDFLTGANIPQIDGAVLTDGSQGFRVWRERGVYDRGVVSEDRRSTPGTRVDKHQSLGRAGAHSHAFRTI
jgi:hypothetical protein